MFDIVKWLAWMGIATFCILILRALFRKPAGANQKRWVNLTTPELLECAFKSEKMYEIAERTAKRHLDKYGTEGLIEFYTELFNELQKGPTTDGFNLSGGITDLGNGRVRLVFTLKSGDDSVDHVYDVNYVHLTRVTDAFSPALLARLEWHKKPIIASQG